MPQNSSERSAIDSKALIGGLVGGGLVFLTGYGYYHYSGASTLVSATKTTKQKLDALTQQIQSSAPPANEALKWMHGTAVSYASFIPGAKSYVDSAFKDLEKVQDNHGAEVEQVVERVYADLKSAVSNDNSQGVTETAETIWNVLQNGMNDIAGLAGDSVQDIISNHPQIKEKIGGSLEQFQGMAKNYGGEDVKKEVKETMQQVKDILASAGTAGLGMETIDKIKKLVQEKSDKVKHLGQKAWEEGYKKAMPYLEKKPEIKKIVEENIDAFKDGNVAEALSKISDVIYSGNAEDLKAYVQSTKEKAKNAASGKDGLASEMMDKGMKYAQGMMPATGLGAEVLPKLQELMRVAESKGEDAEKILKATWEEIVQVLQKKQKEVEKLAEEAKKEGKEKAKR